MGGQTRVTMLVFVVILLYRDPRTAAILRQLVPKRMYKKELNQLLQLGLEDWVARQNAVTFDYL